MFSVTIFDTIYDNRTRKRMDFDSFEKFSDILFKLSRKKGYKPKKDERKRGSSLISPATYKPDTTRANVNVVEWAGWCALDIDDYEGSFEEAIEQFKPYKHICYSSAGSRKEHPKCRIVFELTDPVPQNKIRHFWFALNEHFPDTIDPQCKDLSRMYYVPAKYPNAYNFIFKNEGEVMDPYEVMDEYEYVEGFKSSFANNLPEKMRKAMEEYKKSQLNNIDISWSSYLDCPFVNKRIITEYKSITGTGWYHTAYRIMVSIAGNAIKKKYPITPTQIATLMKEIDVATGGKQKERYGNRPFEREAASAINFVLNNSDFI